MELLTDQKKLLMAVGGMTGLFLGIYGARESTRVIGRTIDRWEVAGVGLLGVPWTGGRWLG